MSLRKFDKTNLSFLQTIADLLQKVQAGRKIDESEIPPPVAAGKSPANLLTPEFPSSSIVQPPTSVESEPVNKPAEVVSVPPVAAPRGEQPAAASSESSGENFFFCHIHLKYKLAMSRILNTCGCKVNNIYIQFHFPAPPKRVKMVSHRKLHSADSIFLDTTILYETVGTFCNKNSVPHSPKSMLSKIVHCEWIRGMCIPTLLGGRGKGKMHA